MSLAEEVTLHGLDQNEITEVHSVELVISHQTARHLILGSQAAEMHQIELLIEQRARTAPLRIPTGRPLFLSSCHFSPFVRLRAAIYFELSLLGHLQVERTASTNMISTMTAIGQS